MPLPSYKVLGQANPSSGTRTALYSVPRFYNSKVTTLTICNTGTVADRFNIEIQDYSSNNTSTAYYTNYNTWINAKDTIILNQHLIIVKKFTFSIRKLSPQTTPMGSHLKRT